MRKLTSQVDQTPFQKILRWSRAGLLAVVTMFAGGVVWTLSRTVVATNSNTDELLVVYAKTTTEQTGDFSQFKHDNAQHARLPCLLCHRRETNSVRPTLPGKSEHAPCAGCHAQQFSASTGPICSICHTDVQAGTVKAFPRLKSFNMKFDHARHLAVGTACATCHRASRGGVALSIPAGANAHTVCFGCHTPQAQANGRNISACSTCHELGRLVRTSERASAFRVGFSHGKHGTSASLRCAECHQVRAGLSPGKQVSSPLALNHHAPERGLSCATCHNGKKAFGGDEFSVCTRCHKGAGWFF